VEGSRGLRSVLHCDLKPENILLRSLQKTSLAVIDFGSACLMEEEMYSYIQSRFYRAPEVLLGMPYNTAIDMWSLACILMEMHTGKPLFDGENEAEQIVKQVEILGIPPAHMILQSKRGLKYFKQDSAGNWQLRSQYQAKYAKGRSLIATMETAQRWLPDDHRCHRFVSMLETMLEYDPRLRVNPRDAIRLTFFNSNTRDIGTQTDPIAIGADSAPSSPLSLRLSPPSSRPHSTPLRFSHEEEGESSNAVSVDSAIRDIDMPSDRSTPASLYRHTGTNTTPTMSDLELDDFDEDEEFEGRGHGRTISDPNSGQSQRRSRPKKSSASFDNQSPSQRKSVQHSRSSSQGTGPLSGGRWLWGRDESERSRQRMGGQASQSTT
jgi:serine/threonine protein kinase